MEVAIKGRMRFHNGTQHAQQTSDEGIGQNKPKRQSNGEIGQNTLNR